MSVCCDVENSFALATTNRTSEIQRFVNFFLSTIGPEISACKLSIFPSGININQLPSLSLKTDSSGMLTLPSTVTTTGQMAVR